MGAERMAASEAERFEEWCAAVEDIIGHSLDGDERKDGYSLDCAWDWYADGYPAERYAEVVARAKRNIAKESVWIVAFGVPDRQFGGHEEGGWWFDTWTLSRVSPFAFKSETAAYEAEKRANRLLDRLNRGKRSISSVLYDGSRYEARALRITEGKIPQHLPEHAPRYE
jgi:hypothetical protein